MEKSEEEMILITDGGYDGQDNIVLAKEKNVKLGCKTIPANIRKYDHLDKKLQEVNNEVNFSSEAK